MMTYKLIHTENYLLVVDDSEIKEGDYYLSKISNDVFRRIKDGHWIENYDKKMYHKVIAHLPLNNSPILQGVDLLPSLEQEDDVEKIAREEILYNDAKREWWKQGYSKAREKYKYTERDLSKAIAAYMDNKSFSEIIQSLSQPKMPVGFERELANIMGKGEPITERNSQGQIQWVGKYIY